MSVFAAVFVLLYVAHLVADYPLQTDWQAAHKADRSVEGWRANVSHAFDHLMVSTAALAVLEVVLGYSVPVVQGCAGLAWIAISHAAIDRRRGVLAWMRLARQTKFQEHGGAAHVDQTAHLVCLLVAALVMSS